MPCTCNKQNSAFFKENITASDPLIAKALEDELIRQNHQIELIASENIVSKAVLEAQGSVFTNKYAEGYSGHRYYGGCEFMDVVADMIIPTFAISSSAGEVKASLLTNRLMVKPMPDKSATP